MPRRAGKGLNQSDIRFTKSITVFFKGLKNETIVEKNCNECISFGLFECGFARQWLRCTGEQNGAERI
jgi:hypothetical protein